MFQNIAVINIWLINAKASARMNVSLNLDAIGILIKPRAQNLEHAPTRRSSEAINNHICCATKSKTPPNAMTPKFANGTLLLSKPPTMTILEYTTPLTEKELCFLLFVQQSIAACSKVHKASATRLISKAVRSTLAANGMRSDLKKRKQKQKVAQR